MSLLRWLDTGFSTRSVRFNPIGLNVRFMVDSGIEEGFGFPTAHYSITVPHSTITTLLPDMCYNSHNGAQYCILSILTH